MNKTPVSILQEIMVKKGSIPNYELIHDGGGTHINTFTYRVTCDGLHAIGTGRCKKNAKHEAASNMLQRIAAHRNYPQLPASPAESPIRTPLPNAIPVSPKKSANVPFVNTIGALQDLCSDNNLNDPEYTSISDVGPPHARVFTIRCSVSNFIEDGLGTTKKQAKHEAAKKMIDKINELLVGMNDMNFEDKYPKIENNQMLVLANENAKAQYPQLTKLPAKRINLGTKLSKYHTVLKDSINTETELQPKILQGLQNIISDDLDASAITDELVAETLSKLESLLSEINITVYMKTTNVNKVNSVPHMKIIELDMFPSFTQIGIGKTEAEASFDALCHMIKALKLFFS